MLKMLDDQRRRMAFQSESDKLSKWTTLGKSVPANLGDQVTSTFTGM
jgi:hypothetical protein